MKVAPKENYSHSRMAHGLAPPHTFFRTARQRQRMLENMVIFWRIGLKALVQVNKIADQSGIIDKLAALRKIDTRV